MSHSMPELPEVEITRRGIEPFVLGKTITGVAVRNPNLRRRVPRNFARLVVGRLVKRVVRRGQDLLPRIDGGSPPPPPRMSGGPRRLRPPTPPPPHPQPGLSFFRPPPPPPPPR